MQGEAILATVAAFAEPFDRLSRSAGSALRQAQPFDRLGSGTERVEGDGLTKGQRAADAVAAMVTPLAADGKTPSPNGHPASATVLIPLSEAERVVDGQVRQPGVLPDCTDLVRSAGDQSFTELPLSTGRIGAHLTLGDAAARSIPEALEGLCASEITGAIVTTGHGSNPTPGRILAALLGAAPLQPLHVGRAQRFATTGQCKALEIRDDGCVIDGCSIELRHCQTHHEPGWADGGVPDLDQLAPVPEPVEGCWPHHRQLDSGKWILKRNPDPNGRHWLTEPQPRHRWRT